MCGIFYLHPKWLSMVQSRWIIESCHKCSQFFNRFQPLIIFQATRFRIFWMSQFTFPVKSQTSFRVPTWAAAKCATTKYTIGSLVCLWHSSGWNIAGDGQVPFFPATSRNLKVASEARMENQRWDRKLSYYILEAVTSTSQYKIKNLCFAPRTFQLNIYRHTIKPTSHSFGKVG